MTTKPDTRLTATDALTYSITGPNGSPAYRREVLRSTTRRGMKIADQAATDYAAGLIDREEVRRRCQRAVDAPY